MTYSEGPIVQLHEGDNRDSLRRLIDKGVKVHSVVTDPPYGLVSVAKRFGKDGSAAAQFGTDGAFGRFSGGFMGKRWDGTFIERDPEFWKLIWEILLPGGYCIAFSGSRTGHWQAVAMEQAGFIMHPMIGWVTGQGFPKAHNASKAIDKELGAEREVVGKRIQKSAVGGNDLVRGNGKNTGVAKYCVSAGDERIRYENVELDITAPGSPEAAQWEGWAYGTQSLKPALEPIYVGQKPFSEKNGALNILKHGVGAMNIDGCRVPTRESTARPQGRDIRGGKWGGGVEPTSSELTTGGSALGRHPANLLHDGSEDVVALFPDTGPSDNGGTAARFFNSFDPEPLFYCPKAGKEDRAGSKHPTVKPIKLMRWLCRLVTPPGGTVLDPFGGSGTTAAAALAEGFNPILMEMEAEYIADMKRRFQGRIESTGGTDPSLDDLLDDLLCDGMTQTGVPPVESVLDDLL